MGDTIKPVENEEYLFNPYKQGYSDTCAIKSQQIILNEFGIECTEDDLVQYSIEKGWYSGNGTNIEDVGNLLDDAGVECTRTTNANVFNLVSELAQGHKIIVGVDSNELRGSKFSAWFNDFFNGESADHALVVAGIDTSDINNIKVIVTDPGDGSYHKAYPLNQFMDAWSDSSCFMVSTNSSVPEYVEGMQNFNYDNGHIDNVAGMDYQSFQVFDDMSSGLPVYAPIDNGYCYPVSSLTDAYFDVVNGSMSYNMMLNNPNYLFNNYLDPVCITPHLVDTYNMGLPQIDFNPMNDWNNYAVMNNIPFMTNDYYHDFLNHSIMDFNAIHDVQSAMYCEQQMMMLDYCDNFGFDFYNTFFN